MNMTKTSKTTKTTGKQMVNSVEVPRNSKHLYSIFCSEGDVEPLFEKFGFATEVFRNESAFSCDSNTPIAAVVVSSDKEVWNTLLAMCNAQENKEADFISFKHQSGYAVVFVIVDSELPILPEHIIRALKKQATKSIGRKMLVEQDEDGTLRLADANREDEIMNNFTQN